MKLFVCLYVYLVLSEQHLCFPRRNFDHPGESINFEQQLRENWNQDEKKSFFIRILYQNASSLYLVFFEQYTDCKIF